MKHKLTSTNFHIMDYESLKKTFTDDEIIDYINGFIFDFIDVVSDRCTHLGLSLARNGSINPKHFPIQTRLGGSEGIKIWISK